MTEQTVPAIIEMEKFVLSSMLLKEGEIIPVVTSILQPGDFYRPEHRITYKAILELAAEGTPPNVLSLSDKMQATGEIKDVGIEFVLALTNIAFTTAYTKVYCEKIREAAELRRVIVTAEKLISDAQKGTVPAAEIYATMATIASEHTNPATTDEDTSISTLLANDFFPYLDSEKRAADRSTGFKNIDENQNLQPGLYLIGGKPAVGKTTFVWQLAEQMACDGETAIYCSYEMSTGLILKKSIVRRIYDSDPFTLITNSNISQRYEEENVQIAITAAMRTIFELKPDLHILELHDENIDTLIRRLKSMCKADKPPVIVIDYVQIIPSSKEVKQALDDALRKLKTFQRDTKSTIFVVSSFNRANYTTSTGFESFKESGILEYTADVVWGLQLWITDNLPSNLKKAREMVDKAIKQTPRKIQLKCLKNRFGGNYDCFFRYYAGNDTFVPAEEDEFKEEYEYEKDAYYDVDDKGYSDADDDESKGKGNSGDVDESDED